MALPGFSCQSKAEPQTKRWPGGQQTKCDKSSETQHPNTEWAVWAGPHVVQYIYVYILKNTFM